MTVAFPVSLFLMVHGGNHDDSFVYMFSHKGKYQDIT